MTQRASPPTEACWRQWLDALPLPIVGAEHLVGDSARAVIVAPHPDDEILIAGGLVQALASMRVPVALVAVTDGDGSHPRSRRFKPHMLRRIRAAETAQALDALGLGDVLTVRLHLGDRRVSTHEAALRRFLQRFLHAGDIAITTWHGDGHADHDACGRATLGATREMRIACIEAPVWSWRSAAPREPRLPWARARGVALTPLQRARKKTALSCFRSQIRVDPTCPGTPLLDAQMLKHFDRPFEVFFA